MPIKPEKLETLQQTWKETYVKFGKGSEEVAEQGQVS